MEGKSLIPTFGAMDDFLHSDETLFYYSKFSTVQSYWIFILTFLFAWIFLMLPVL